MRENFNDTPRSRRQGLRLTPQEMTSAELGEIDDILQKIDAAVDGSDLHALTQALALFLIATVGEAYEMPPRDAVAFTADCIRRYGQIILA